MKRIIFLVLVIFFSAQVHAGKVAQATGEIYKVMSFTKGYNNYNVNDTGLFTFYMDTLPPACNSKERRVSISTDHPLYQTVVSTILMARASNMPVTVWYIDTCSQRSNSWDFAVIEIN